MKKVFKIGCLGFVALFAIILVLVIIAKRYDAPTQSIMFLNTSSTVKSVTFEMIDKDGKLSDTSYYVNRIIKPNESIIKEIPEGNYKIQVWNDQEKLYKETKFKFELKTPKESNYQLYRFDLAMNKNFAIICLNAIYEGNTFAEHMSNAVGTNYDQLEIQKIHNGNLPFLISEIYTNRTFLDLEDIIPSRIKYGELVYGLFAFPDSLSKTQIHSLLYEKITYRLSK